MSIPFTGGFITVLLVTCLSLLKKREFNPIRSSTTIFSMRIPVIQTGSVLMASAGVSLSPTRP
jgi:hypothetical protein